MKIVIDIPEEIMEYVKNNGCLSVIYDDEVAKVIINGTPYEDRPQGEFTIDELKKWLYEIAYNNTNNDFGKYCVEIVDRLNGFKRFVADMRKEAKE